MFYLACHSVLVYYMQKYQHHAKKCCVSSMRIRKTCHLPVNFYMNTHIYMCISRDRIRKFVSINFLYCFLKPLVYKDYPAPNTASTKSIHHKVISEQRVSITKKLQNKEYPSQRDCRTKSIHHKEYPSQRVSITKSIHHKEYPSQRVSITKRLQNNGYPSQRDPTKKEKSVCQQKSQSLWFLGLQ